MAIFAATDYAIKINSTDYSDWITQVSVPMSVAELDTMAFGDTWETYIGGRKSATVTISFHQDFVDNGLDEVIFGLLGTVTAVAVKPTSAGISDANPEYQFDVLVTEWTPINATVGDLATVDVTWRMTGPPTRDVTA